ncbi:MAG: CvpA family protein [Clostridia bacterium]|nr:CvpA family protein [Clostridia bacterium]
MKRSLLTKLLLGAASAIVLFIAYWFVLPPLNLRSPDFWSFLIFAVILVTVLFAGNAIFKSLKELPHEKGHFAFMKIKGAAGLGIKIVLGSIAAVVAVNLVAAIIGMPIFNAKGYYNLISVSDGNFAEDIAEIDMSAIPVVDRDTASRLGRRKLGEMKDLVSQFEITPDFTQINYNNSPYRVTTLTYGDVFKWLNNQSEGIPAYITVDMVTQEASLVRLEEGIKYSEGEYFYRNIHRYLRFNYPTKIFDELCFEIDDKGTPYWIAPCITYRIGIWSGKDIEGAVLVNAVTGEHEYLPLDKIPSWVDQVFISDLVVEQLNYYGLYVNGFWNSIFGQQDVLQTTQGYNYLAIDDDVWLYTGMTSVASDESNVGFVLVNLRTKEARFYTVPGAEEYSAMDSAKGQVQHLNYSSTFPILLNIADRPTYFVSLKDDAGLVKLYAFVDVERYQIVGTGATVAEAKADYAAKLKSEDIEVPGNLTADITVSDVRFLVTGGESNAYIYDSEGNIWIIPVSLDSRLAFIENGSTVSVEYSEANGVKAVTKVTSVTLNG